MLFFLQIVVIFNPETGAADVLSDGIFLSSYLVTTTNDFLTILGNAKKVTTCGRIHSSNDKFADVTVAAAYAGKHLEKTVRVEMCGWLVVEMGADSLKAHIFELICISCLVCCFCY